MEILYWLEKLVRYMVTNDLISPLVSFVGIIVSALVLRATIKALNEQNRPFISFSIEPIKKVSNLYMVIRNTGNRTAEYVVITTKPKLISYCSEKKRIPLISTEDNKISLSGIAPNQVIKSFFDTALYRYSQNKEKDKLNDKFEINISYKYKKQQFEDIVFIDFSYLKEASQINSPDDVDQNIKKIADNLEKINSEIRRINENNQALKN